MTPKEKAQELVDKYYQLASLFKLGYKKKHDKSQKLNNELNVYLLEYWNELAKQSALMQVRQIINELTQEISPSVHGFRHRYWKEVKQEIEKL